MNMINKNIDVKFSYIDLFAGIGGIRRPFDKLGGRCVFASEIDKFALQSYYANYGEMPQGDITQIAASDIPNFDVLLAGFPCQPFSVAGNKRGFDDTRGTMFFEIERILEYHRPKAFLLENVKGLINHNKGSTFKVIIDTLVRLGYKVFNKVLNARDFGVPQNRARVIIVGFDNKDAVFDFPEPINCTTRVGDILDDKVDDKYTLSDNLWRSLQNIKKKHEQRGNGFGYKITNKDDAYTNTISARYYKDGSEILIAEDDKNPRRLTPREAARLQGFGDDFKIVVSDVQAYKQFGNSVATKMLDYVAYNMIKTMELV